MFPPPYNTIPDVGVAKQLLVIRFRDYCSIGSVLSGNEKQVKINLGIFYEEEIGIVRYWQ